MKCNERRFSVFLIALIAFVAVGCGTGQTPAISPITPTESTAPTSPPSVTPASVRITASPSPFHVGMAGHIVVQVSEPASAMELDFGDGIIVRVGVGPSGHLGSTNSIDVVTIYTDPGDFTVTATVTTARGAVVRGTLTLSVVS